MARLVDQQAELSKANADLRARLSERDTQVRALEERLRTANQQRRDVGKRIDELIAQIDQLDAELGAQES